MDSDLFLQQLRDFNLEDGHACIQAHAAELEDHASFGDLLAEEALNQLYTNPTVSLKLAEQLIFFGKYVQHAPSHALGLKAKGDALRVLGLHQAAIDILDAAGEEFLSLGDEGNWARTRISWITARAWLGYVEEALQEAALARDVFLRLGEYYWVYVIDSNIAAIYSQTGQYQDALSMFTDMLAIYPTLKDQSETFIKRAVAIAEANQGEILSWLGKFEQAYHLLLKAQGSFIDLKETSLIIHLEIRLADLDYIQGYYGSALGHYYQASDGIVKNNDDPLQLAELKFRMANCLLKLNRSQEACQLAAEATEAFRQLDVSLDTGNALCEYASTLMFTSKLKEALTALDEAEILFTLGGFDGHAFTTKLQQAEILLEMGSAPEAYDQAYLVKDYFEAQGLIARSIRANMVMAGALIERAQQAKVRQEKKQQAILLQEAVSICKRVALQARKHNLQEEVYKSHYLLGRLFAFQGSMKGAVRHYRAAITQIERILDNLPYDLSPSFLHTTWAVYEDMIALCLQQSQFERALSYLERARSMALRQYLNKSNASEVKKEELTQFASSLVSPNGAIMLRMQQELKEWQERYRQYSALLSDRDTLISLALDQKVIEDELKQCEAKLNELFERLHLLQSDTPLTFHTKRREARKINDLDIAQLRQQLSPDQLLLAYFLYKGGIVIFAASADKLITYENPDGLAQLERLLPLLYAHLEPDGWPDIQRPPQQVIRRLLNKLYDLLVAPIAKVLPSSPGNLTIVPYGPLHKLPFHALHDGSHFLIENFQINYLPASNMLMHLNNRKRDEGRDCSKGASLFSKPPLVFGYSGNGHLQRTIDEAKMLAALLNGRCYLEGEATIAQLIEQAPGCPIIHIATHGHSRLDAPNFSYVLLADGQLNAIDAFSLNLERCELVTLSGCETGLALSGGGDEQLGLGRAFLAAGAKSLVMSLWPVEDNATNELMRLFYQRLLSGDTRVQALRAAQCSLMYRSSIYAHPYFWAAFRLVGDTGTLDALGGKKSAFAIETEPPKKRILDVPLSDSQQDHAASFTGIL